MKKSFFTKLNLLMIFALVGMFCFIACGKKNPATNAATGSNGEASMNSDTMRIIYEEAKAGNSVILWDDVEKQYSTLVVSEQSPENKLVIVGLDFLITEFTVILEDSSGNIIERKAEDVNEKCEINLGDIATGEYEFAFMQNGEGEHVCYLSTDNMFRAMLESAQRPSRIAFLKNIVSSVQEDLVITSPFIWDMNGFSYSTDYAIRFKDDGPGNMIIRNRYKTDLKAKEITCDAVLWDLDVWVPPDVFYEEMPYYIYANSSVNGEIDVKLVYIDSVEKWEALFKEGKLSVNDSVEKMIISGDFSISGQRIDKPLSVCFVGNIDVDGVLEFDFLDDAEILIDYSQNESQPIDEIFLNTPNSFVGWKADFVPSFSYVEEQMNVEYFKGTATDIHMGGDGTVEILSGTITDGNNGNSISFVPKGNVINVSLGYTESISLDNATISGELTGDGEISLISYNSKYYCLVKDSDGNTRGYRIDTYSSEYKLPILYITTDDGAGITSKDAYKSSKITLDYNGAYDFTNITNIQAGVKGRGNSSWRLDKKPYKIKFENGTSLFGLEKAKRWVLIANHVDRSLIRNDLAYAIGEVLDNMVFIPSSYMVDVFVNGKYMGVYQLSEQIEINEGRIPGEENSSEVDTDYLLELGGDKLETPFGYNNFSTDLFKWVEIKNPDEENLSLEQYAYIKDYVNQVEEAVMAGEGYEELLDIPSLIDWFLLYEFSYNLDGAFRRSDFLLKEKGGKLYFCTPWDFDYAFGNMSLDTWSYQEWICLGNANTDAYDMYIKTNIMDYLLKDANFTAKLKARWDEVGKLMLSTALATIDEAEINLLPSANENFKRWRIMGSRLQYENNRTVNLYTYEEQLDYLRDFINNRYAWMDLKISQM